MLREIDLRAPGDHAHLRAALRDGFFLVRNTVPDGLLDEAYGLLGDFFRLPAEQKAACQVPGSNGQSGYLPPLVETAEKGAAPDWKELFHWGAALPAAHPLRERYPARYREPYFPDHLVPGIGKAKAAKLLLEYKDKLGAPHGSVPAQKPVAAGPAPWHEQLHAALVGLGYAPREAEEAVARVTPEAEAQSVPDVGALLRLALRGLNRAR